MVMDAYLPFMVENVKGSIQNFIDHFAPKSRALSVHFLSRETFINLVYPSLMWPVFLIYIQLFIKEGLLLNKQKKKRMKKNVYGLTVRNQHQL